MWLCSSNYPVSVKQPPLCIIHDLHHNQATTWSYRFYRSAQEIIYGCRVYSSIERRCRVDSSCGPLSGARGVNRTPQKGPAEAVKVEGYSDKHQCYTILYKTRLAAAVMLMR